MTKMRFHLAVLSLLTCLAAAAEEPVVQVAADPAAFPAGGSTLVSITFTKDPGANGVALPDVSGGVWHADRVARSRNLSVVNGVRSDTLTFSLPLSSDRPGELVIPPFEVRFADGTTARSEPVKLKVLSPGEAPPPPPGVEAEIVLSAGRSVFYVGEEIPVEFVLALPERMEAAEIGFPQIDCDGPAVLPDLSGRRTRHPHFSDPVEGVRRGPGGRMRTIAFRTRLRFMSAGEFSLKAAEELAVFARGDSFDDLFSAARLVPRDARRVRLEYPARKLRIVPVPPHPEGTHPLGMAGNVRVEVGISGRSARVGEALELEVKLAGAENFTGIEPPALEFSGFRVYPPELKTAPDGMRSIRYALIPLHGGEYELGAGFSLFDPASGEWRTGSGNFQVAVTGPPAQDAATRVEVAGDAPERFAPLPEDESRIALPPAKRGVRIGIAVFVVLALAALAIELGRKLRRRGPEAERRRETAAAIRRLEDGENAESVLGSGGMAVLARALELAEDASPEAVAERVGDAELAAALVRIERNAFVPEAERQKCELSESGRRKLVKLLKRALVIAALFATFGATGAECRSAANCYNAGIAYLHDGELPQARLWLERAYRFAPRDGRIRAALNAAERELKLPASRPGLRDRIRPDEYLAAAGVLFGGALVVFAALRKKRKKSVFAASGILILAGLAAVLLAWSQHAGDAPYSADRTIVLRDVELASLPSGSGGHAVGTLDGGGEAVIVEERGDFIRVCSGDRDGWCRRSDAERVFPAR